MARYKTTPCNIAKDVWMIQRRKGLFGAWVNEGFGSWIVISEMCTKLNGERVKDITTNQNRIVSVLK